VSQLPRVQGIDRLHVIVHAGLCRTDQRDLVGHIAQVRQQLREFHTALTARRKLPRAGEHFRAGLRGIVILNAAWERLAIPALHLGFGVEQIDMAGPTLHEQRNHRPRLWLGMGHLGAQIEALFFKRWLQGRGKQLFFVQQPRQGNAAKSHGSGCHEVSPCRCVVKSVIHVGHGSVSRRKGTDLN